MMENKNKFQDTASEPNQEVLYRMPVSKRIFDLVVAIGLLYILLPFLILVVIAILLESQGPVFHSVARIGSYLKRFNLYKFRTIRQPSDAYIINEIPDFAMNSNDPRITRVGRIIRNTGIEALPQLINVIKGDLSIVGNDPLPMYEVEQFMHGENAKRFLAPAGIISPWQVYERSRGPALSENDRISIENAYADHFASGNYSIWDDLTLIFRRFR